MNKDLMKKYQTYILLAIEKGRHYHEVYMSENIKKLLLAFAIENKQFLEVLREVTEIADNLTDDDIGKMKVSVN